MEQARERLVAAISAAERATLPDGADFYYYNTLEGFSGPVAAAGRRLRSLAAAARPADAMAAGDAAAATDGDADDLRGWVAERVQDALERCDTALDAAQRQLRADSGGAGTVASAAISIGAAVTAVSAAQAAAGRHGQYAQSIADIPKPQERFADAVDNSDAPFVPRPAISPWSGRQLPATMCQPPTYDADGNLQDRGGFPHPLREQIDTLVYPEWQLEAAEPQRSQSLEATPFSYVDTLESLQVVAARLAGAREVAVDLEHHSFRSYQGFVCLMQLSTREEDIVVDALALRPHIGPVLGPMFADAATVKVLHGADHDILWLQRDFGIYVVNMFDTGQAARVLEFPGHGLKYLLQHFCGVHVNKAHQMADWRARPLDPAMLAYAREDTHHLLYVADRLKVLLVEAGDRVPETLDPWARAEDPSPPPQRHPPIPSKAMAATLERSRRLCLLRYEKESLDEPRLAAIYDKATGTPQQRAAVEGLHKWRDAVAREEDENTGYVLPRALLLKIAAGLPGTAEALREIVHAGAKVVLRRAAEVLAVIDAAQRAPAQRPISAAPAQRQPAALQPGTAAVPPTGIPGMAAAASAAMAAAASSGATAAADADAGAEKAPKRPRLQARRVPAIAAARGSAFLQTAAAASSFQDVAFSPPAASSPAAGAARAAAPAAAEQGPAAPAANSSGTAPAAGLSGPPPAAEAPPAAAAPAKSRLAPRTVPSISRGAGGGVFGSAAGQKSAAASPAATAAAAPSHPAAADAGAAQQLTAQPTAAAAAAAGTTPATAALRTAQAAMRDASRLGAEFGGSRKRPAEETAQQEAVQRLRTSFQLPFARLEPEPAQPSGEATTADDPMMPQQKADAAAAATAGPRQTTGADIRAFVDAMSDDDAAQAAESEASPQQAAQQQQQRHQQSAAAAAQLNDTAEEAAEAAEAAEGAKRKRTDFLASGPDFLDLAGLSEDFRPLSARERKQKKGGKRQKADEWRLPQRRQVPVLAMAGSDDGPVSEPATSSSSGDDDAGGGNSLAAGDGGSDALQQAYRRIGLDSDSDGAQPRRRKRSRTGPSHPIEQAQQPGKSQHAQRVGSKAERQAASKKHSKQAARQLNKADAGRHIAKVEKKPGAVGVDLAADRAAAPGLHLRMSAGLKAGRGRGGGRGGGGGAGGGRGRGRGRGRGAAAVKESFNAVPPPAASAGSAPAIRGPYGMSDEGLLKGGKRSAVAPRSGNKQMTFGR